MENEPSKRGIQFIYKNGTFGVYKTLFSSKAPADLSRNMVLFDLPLTSIYLMSIYFKIV